MKVSFAFAFENSQSLAANADKEVGHADRAVVERNVLDI